MIRNYENLIKKVNILQQQGRIHGYLSRVRLGRGSNKSLQASKQQNPRLKIDVTDQRTNGPTDQLTNQPTDRPTNQPTNQQSGLKSCVHATKNNNDNHDNQKFWSKRKQKRKGDASQIVS